MNKKLKNVLKVFLFIIITCACIALGFKTRYDAKIKINTIKDINTKESIGYMLKTSENNIVMIDGGNSLDKDMVKDYINANGGKVEYWFITNFKADNIGALNEILTENSIEVNNIIISLNSDDWYEVNSGEDYVLITSFLENLRKEEIMPKVCNAALRQEFKIDNLNIKVLKVAGVNATENIIDSQTMCLKVDNMFKSVMFLSSLPINMEEDFINNNLDEIEAEGVQTYNNTLTNEILEKVLPEVYIDKGEKYTEIW